MEAFRTYATEHDPALLEPPKADAIVHYRVGDVLVNEPPILPHSIAKALASFSPQPKSIEVLNGGFQSTALTGESLKVQEQMSSSKSTIAVAIQ